MEIDDDEVLVTPCCQTKIIPAAGFRSVFCCSEEYTRDDLED
jgi:hypothetical protein